MLSIISRGTRLLRDLLSRRSNFRAHFWQSAANYSQQGGAVIIGIILARLLSPEDFGKFAYPSAMIGIALLPLDWTAAQVLVSDAGKTPQLYSEVMSLSITICFIKLIITLGVALWQTLGGEPTRAILICLTAIPLIAGTLSSVLRSAVEGAGTFKANFQVQFVTITFTSLVGVVTAILGWGAFSLAAMGIVSAIPPFCIYPRYISNSFHWKFNGNILKARGNEGFWIWLNGISEAGIFRLDKLALGKWSTDAQLGNYNRAFNYTNLSSWALNSFMTNPAVVALAKAGSPHARFRILVVNATILMTGATCSFIVFFFFSDPLVPVIFGEQWRGAIPAFKAFSSINIVLTALYLPVTYLLSQKQFIVLSISRFIGFSLFLLAVYFNRSILSQTLVAAYLQIALAFSAILCWIALFLHFKTPTKS